MSQNSLTVTAVMLVSLDTPHALHGKVTNVYVLVVTVQSNNNDNDRLISNLSRVVIQQTSF